MSIYLPTAREERVPGQLYSQPWHVCLTIRLTITRHHVTFRSRQTPPSSSPPTTMSARQTQRHPFLNQTKNKVEYHLDQFNKEVLLLSYFAPFFIVFSAFQISHSRPPRTTYSSPQDLCCPWCSHAYHRLSYHKSACCTRFQPRRLGSSCISFFQGFGNSFTQWRHPVADLLDRFRFLQFHWELRHSPRFVLRSLVLCFQNCLYHLVAVTCLPRESLSVPCLVRLLLVFSVF